MYIEKTLTIKAERLEFDRDQLAEIIFMIYSTHSKHYPTETLEIRYEVLKMSF